MRGRKGEAKKEKEKRRERETHTHREREEEYLRCSLCESGPFCQPVTINNVPIGKRWKTR